MARNYMRDIQPPSDEPEERRPRAREIDEDGAKRSIRNIRPSAARERLTPHHLMESDTEQYPPQTHVPHARHVHRRKRPIGIWIAVGIVSVILAVAALLMLFPSTSVTVMPRTQVITFDASMPFTAYPEAGATPGTIAYAVQQQSFEDSAVVQASGTEQAQEQAKGKVTVYNGTAKIVALIKNTRFQTPDGKIFRIPVSIDVPASSSMEVEVFADQAGPEYNVGPFEKLTVPGLKSSTEMYEKVYAKSSAAFSGGFVGERPAVTESVLQAAQAEVRGRLQEKANQFAQTAPEGVVAFPGLMAIRFETLAPTEEGSGSVRINERATVSVPVFPSDRLAQSIAQTVSANAEGQSVRIKFADITGAPAGALNAADLGQQPVTFTLGGRGLLVWNVDAAALSEALAGKEEAAFETVIGSFPSIEEARARLMPFWKSNFPEEGKIRVNVEEPASF